MIPTIPIIVNPISFHFGPPSLKYFIEYEIQNREILRSARHFRNAGILGYNSFLSCDNYLNSLILQNLRVEMEDLFRGNSTKIDRLRTKVLEICRMSQQALTNAK